MLRLPRFELRQPTSLGEASRLLGELGPNAMVLAGGTDLLPNMKHELFTPPVVVSLGRVQELRGIARGRDGTLVIGAMTTIAEVAANALVRRQAPALAQAAGLVSGPQLRRAGTIGGNVLLETRCQYYNQSYFWRSALGFCLKKDGTVCHVVAGGSRCVAAASADSAPALMTLGAVLEIEGATGRRTVPIDEFWISDGIVNRRLAAGEILVSIRVPPTPPGHRGAYGKLRERGSIDFPLLGVACRLDVGDDDRVEHGDVVLTALAARPKRIRGAASRLAGARLGTEAFRRAVEEVAVLAYRQCHTLANVPGDEEWRREMIPVYVRRTLHAAAEGNGPVHHV
jgi:4-hydroxybenzoyl-CoA reductase subunit beta